LPLPGWVEWTATVPAVASDGADFLVVWDQESDLQGARVAADGTVLDAVGISIAPDPQGERWPAVTYDGANYLVVWEGSSDGGPDGGSGIRGALVSADGTVIDSGFAIAASPSTEQYPAVASNETTSLVVWFDASLSALYGARVAQSGAVLDAALPISTTPDYAAPVPAVASDGAGFLVTWSDLRDSGSGNDLSDVYGTRVSGDGVVLDPSGIAISTLTGTQHEPSVAYNGADYLVVWQDGPYEGGGGIGGARVTADGVLLDPVGIHIGAGEMPAVASDGTLFLAVWDDAATDSATMTTHSDVLGARVSAAGVVQDGPAFVVSTAANQQLQPAVSFDGTTYLVVWEDYRGGWQGDIYGTRLGADGTVLDPSGLAISTAAGQQARPALAFDGTNHMVVWEDYRAGLFQACPDDDQWCQDHPQPAADIYAARVSPAGAVLDPEGLPIATAPHNEGAPAIAASDSGLLVVWLDGDVYVDVGIRGTRVGPGGMLLDPSGLPIWGSGVQGMFLTPPPVAVASNGTDYLVVWLSTANTALGSRVQADGTLLDPSALLLGSDTGYSPAVASDGTDYRVSWGVYTGCCGTSDIFGTRVTAGGTVLDPSALLTDTGFGRQGTATCPRHATGTESNAPRTRMSRRGRSAGRPRRTVTWRSCAREPSPSVRRTCAIPDAYPTAARHPTMRVLWRNRRKPTPGRVRRQAHRKPPTASCPRLDGTAAAGSARRPTRRTRRCSLRPCFSPRVRSGGPRGESLPPRGRQSGRTPALPMIERRDRRGDTLSSIRRRYPPTSPR
jgi:hypothetical protein